MIRKLKNVFVSIIDSLIRNISGGIGERIRYAWYKHVRLGRCGKNVRIKESVYFYNPENIFIGDDVVIMAHSILDAPDNQVKKSSFTKEIENSSYSKSEALILIGTGVQIGAFNIISGLGGIEIRDKVTLSARVSLYSSSHMPNMPSDNSEITGSNNMIKDLPVPSIKSPLVLCENVWMGLNSIMFKGTIGKNSFIKTNSVVLGNIAENVVAEGNPAQPIKDRFK